MYILEYVFFLLENAHSLTDTLQLTYIPLFLAEYIQCQYINSTDIYSPMYTFVLYILPIILFCLCVLVYLCIEHLGI